MSQTHPDDLLDAARRGDLLPDERRELDAHLAICPACAFGLRVMDDIADETKPAASDEERLARLVGRVMDAQESPRPVSVVAPLGRSRARRTTLWLLAAAALVAGIAAARVMRPSTPDLEPARAPEQAPRLEPAPVESPLPSSSPLVEAEETAAPVPRAVPPRPVARPRPPSAAELFARANDARTGGRDSDAVALYRELEREYPASREAPESRLALGRLLLDKGHDPSGALRELDRYLEGGGPLREEALVGRALALGALGRTAEERVAWQTLLDEHPDSIHATRARERLMRLESH